MWLRNQLKKMQPLAEKESGPVRVQLFICRDCNHQLGRHYEDRASQIMRPLIANIPHHVSLADQRFIAEWYVKTDLLTRIRDRSSTQDTYDNERTQLHALMQRGLPLNVSVRMAAYHPGDEGECTYRDLFPSGFPGRIDTYATPQLGLTAAEIVFGGPKLIAQYVHHAPDGRLQRIWPPRTSSLSWPPAQQLTKGDRKVLQAALLRAAGGGQTRSHTWERSGS